MLTDEEIDNIITTHPSDDYRAIFDLCKDIERAVLAKAPAQQERLHKEWSELWTPIDEAVRPLTPLGESVAAKALELINTAKAVQKQEPIYMWRLEDDGWMECTKEFFDAAISAGYEKRIVYPTPQPAQAAAIPDQWRQIVTDLANELESEVMAKYTLEHLKYPSQKAKFDADMASVYRARSLLSASPKPE